MKNIFFLMILTALIWSSSCGNYSKYQAPEFDWQGHRGARGLVPENSIPSFLKAVEYGMNTLEMDVGVSKDNIVVVSHEPWMTTRLCLMPDGSPIDKGGEGQYRFMYLNYDEIKQFDCGSKGLKRFPNQQKMKVHKPSLASVFEVVEEKIKDENLPQVAYNIEIKSHHTHDGEWTPPIEDFVKYVIETIEDSGIDPRRICIQSFDARPLQIINQKHPEYTLSWLVYNEKDYDQKLKELDFIPDVYSPNFEILNSITVKALQNKGMKVIPWTVNEISDMKNLIAMGVDGIITDFPDRAAQVRDGK